MKLKGEYVNAMHTIDGDLHITFKVDELSLADLVNLKGEVLSIDIDKYHKKRSLNANAYLWALCTDIARKIGSNKDTIYLMMLSRYGTWQYIEVLKEAIPVISKHFRYVEVDHEYVADLNTIYGVEEKEMVCLKCYEGSSTYNTKQMSDLLSGIISEANDIGVETCTTEEFKELIKSWRPH